MLRPPALPPSHPPISCRASPLVQPNLKPVGTGARPSASQGEVWEVDPNERMEDISATDTKTE